MKAKFKKSFMISVIIAIVTITCAMGFGCGYVWSLKSNLEHDLHYFLSEVSKQGAGNLNAKIQSNLKILESIAILVGKQDDLHNESVMTLLKNEQQANPQFQRMGIILPDGSAVTTWGEKGNLAGREYFQKALAGISNTAGPMSDVFTGQEINAFGIPILNKDNQISGVLSATLEMESLKQVMEVTSFNGKGFSCVINAQGDIIVDNRHADRAFAKSNIMMLNFSDFNSKQKLEENLSLGLPGLASYYLNDEKRYLSYAPIGVNDWYIVSVVPAAAVGEKTGAILKIAVLFWIGVIVIFAGLFLIISYLHFKRVREFEQYVDLDDLTGLCSWKKFQRDAGRLLDESHHINYALLALDINKFKSVIDLYGNRHADGLLAELGNVINQNTGKYELCARYMADAFVVLLLYKNDDDIINRIDKIMAEADAQITKPYISLSVGIYKISDISVPVSIMNDYAILAKSHIKNSFDLSYCFFDDEMYDLIVMEQKYVSAMEESLACDHFLVYFQPKYRLCDRTISGAEALVRWVHPEMGFLSPGDFIPIFEKNGFITNLDLYVFENVCKTLKEWLASDIEAKTVSVNLSRLHLKDLEIAEKLQQIVSFYGIPPSLIEIEFTENVMMQYSPLLDDILKRFHEIGFSVAIDDFGKGYSSLGLLQDLEVDVLKLDRDFFIKDMQSPRTRAIIASIIRMARELAMETVSEGIETREQVEILEELGCDVIQGYFFARPMPVFEFRELLLKEQWMR